MRPAEGKIAARFPAKISACLALRTAFNSIREMDAREKRALDRHFPMATLDRFVMIAVLALLHDPPSARELSRAMPYAKQGDCPSGYYTSGGFCAPLNKDSRPAVAKPPGASCPSGWYQSGAACVKLNR
jgi:hypothetical protein